MFKRLLSNYISFTGLLLAVVCLIAIVFVLLAAWLGFDYNPYIGVVAFMVLPALVAVGVILIPLGKAWERRRLARAEGVPSSIIRFELDLDRPRIRRRIVSFVVIGTFALALLGATTYEAIGFMDTTTFCGEVCHTVMQPELTSYRHSPHARVNCVECHIGEGADWFVKSKMSGVRQVFAVAFETYSKPIPTPVENLRPARETCEHCHWPAKFHGSRLVVNTHYDDDSANSAVTNVLMMNVGGGSGDRASGIHRHMAIDVEYVALDHERDSIAYVKSTDQDGTVSEYVWEDSPLSLEELRTVETRTMDCMDCHNRPSHTYEDPNQALDREMQNGHISPDLPFVKREAFRLLTADYATRKQAEQRVTDGLVNFYRTEFPQLAMDMPADIQQAANTVADIYLRNVFPKMNVTWGTYPNHIGHSVYPGCYRCHDEEHVTADGKTISQDCELCHSIMAYEEEEPEVLDMISMH